MLAVKNCWALTANQPSSFVQFLPLCLHLLAVAGKLHCRHRSARFAPALLESPGRSPGMLRGLLLPGAARTTPLALLCTPGKVWLSLLPLYFCSWPRVILNLQPAKCPTMLAAFSGDMSGGLMGWFLSSLIFPHNFVSKNFSLKGILSGNLRLEKLHQQNHHIYMIRMYSYMHNLTSKSKKKKREKEGFGVFLKILF